MADADAPGIDAPPSTRRLPLVAFHSTTEIGGLPTPRRALTQWKPPASPSLGRPRGGTGAQVVILAGLPGADATTDLGARGDGPGRHPRGSADDPDSSSVPDVMASYQDGWALRSRSSSATV